MKPIDAAGNLLNEKDFVGVHVNTTVLTGIVQKIKEASVVMSRANESLPGSITIQIPVTIVYNPQMPRLAQVFKLVKPPGFESDPS